MNSSNCSKLRLTTKSKSGWYNVGGIGFDSAFVDASLDSNVAGETPVGPPRITNHPVVDSVESAPTDDDYSVIDIHVITSIVVVHISAVIRLKCDNVVFHFTMKRRI